MGVMRERKESRGEFPFGPADLAAMVMYIMVY